MELDEKVAKLHVLSSPSLHRNISVVFRHEPRVGAACFVEVLEGNHSLQERVRTLGSVFFLCWLQAVC